MCMCSAFVCSHMSTNQTAQKYLFARVGLYTFVEVDAFECASVFLSTHIRGGLLGKGTVEGIRRFPIMTDC